MNSNLKRKVTQIEEKKQGLALLHSSIIEQNFCYPKDSVIVASH